MNVLSGFVQFDPQSLEDLFNEADLADGRPTYADRVIVMPPYEGRSGHGWPVVMPSFFNVKGTLWIGLRVAVFQLTAHGPQAWGWRFDPPDAVTSEDEIDAATHAYPHVQRIGGWRRDASGFLPSHLHSNAPAPSAGPRFDEDRPAFPLAPCNPEGLIACAILSLYGSLEGGRILDSAPGHGITVPSLVRPVLDL